MSSRRVHIHVRRQDSAASRSYWQEFVLQAEASATIADVLSKMATQPLDVNGSAVSPVVWNNACTGSASCGVCLMHVNGEPRVACQTLVHEFTRDIRLEPLKKFPVLRDLWVDRSRVQQQLAELNWDPLPDPVLQALSAPKRIERQALYETLSQCSSCGACLEACPQYSADSGYLGAVSAVLADRLQLNGSFNASAQRSVDRLESAGGLEDCGHVQACAAACPAKIPTTESIARVNRTRSGNALRRFFGQ